MSVSLYNHRIKKTPRSLDGEFLFYEFPDPLKSGNYLFSCFWKASKSK
jgi:hypothetical protein